MPQDSYRENILRLNEQLGRQGLACFYLEKLSRAKPDGIIISGVGGSGLAGEILAATQKELGLSTPILIWKDYGLPIHHFKKPLYVFVSFSGKTEEPLSGFRKILSQRHMIAAIATGGALAKEAAAKKIPYVLFLPGNLTPRQGTGRMFYSLIEILRVANGIKKVPEFTRIRPSSLEARGKKLARYFQNRLIVIYTSTRNKHLGYIWKIRFNESAKVPAFSNTLPEMNHNETAGFDRKKNPRTVALFLEDKKDNPRIQKRFAITEALLRNRGISIVRIPLTEKTELAAVWHANILAEWTSYYLAKLQHIDPRQTKIIDTLKQRMG